MHCDTRSFMRAALIGALAVWGGLAHGPATAQTFTVLYTFTGGADGANPDANLALDAQGNLYGTTYYGGIFNSENAYPMGAGVAFKLDALGHFSVLHAFTSAPDGANPDGPLTLDAQGNLYGTTSFGGDALGGSGAGIVFMLDPMGSETVLHTFNPGSLGKNDGAGPMGALVRDKHGDLYGTTSGGGVFQGGTVYKVDPTGNETILHSFLGSTDGDAPFSGLVSDKHGNLYGTTILGGVNGFGVVYELSRHGKRVTAFHSFTEGSDGGNPWGGIARDKKGNLYGTTNQGGAFGHGVVFKVDKQGNYTLLHTFTGGADGAQPTGDLLQDSQGNLYGTANGGASNGGVVFKIDSAGHYSVLYTFTGGADGAAPHSGLVMDGQGNLYGTAFFGGTTSSNFPNGAGVVFKLTPTP